MLFFSPHKRTAEHSLLKIIFFLASMTPLCWFSSITKTSSFPLPALLPLLGFSGASFRCFPHTLPVTCFTFYLNTNKAKSLYAVLHFDLRTVSASLTALPGMSGRHIWNYHNKMLHFSLQILSHLINWHYLSVILLKSKNLSYLWFCSFL